MCAYSETSAIGCPSEVQCTIDILSFMNASTLSVHPEMSSAQQSIADHLPGEGTSAFDGDRRLRLQVGSRQRCRWTKPRLSRWY